MNKQVLHYLFQEMLDTERKASRINENDLEESARLTQIDLVRKRVL